MCVVKIVCDDCYTTNIDDKSVCDYCGKNEYAFNASAKRNYFCKWLFSGENKDAKVICHNFKRYDSYPIMNYLYENGIQHVPEVIMDGSTFIGLEVPKCKIRFLESINFIPMPLAIMPKTFGCTVLAKGYFQHLFNTTENQSAVLN